MFYTIKRPTADSAIVTAPDGVEAGRIKHVAYIPGETRGRFRPTAVAGGAVYPLGYYSTVGEAADSIERFDRKFRFEVTA